MHGIEAPLTVHDTEVPPVPPTTFILNSFVVTVPVDDAPPGPGLLHPATPALHVVDVIAVGGGGRVVTEILVDCADNPKEFLTAIEIL